jgi:hypothetical protein
MAPRWSFQLGFARAMRACFPGLVRSGVRRMDPVSRQVVDAARARAEQGLPLGQDDER